MSLEEKIERLIELEESQVEKWDQYLKIAEKSLEEKNFYEMWEFWFQVVNFATLFLVLYTNAYSMNPVKAPPEVVNLLDNLTPFEFVLCMAVLIIGILAVSMLIPKAISKVKKLIQK